MTADAACFLPPAGSGRNARKLTFIVCILFFALSLLAGCQERKASATDDLADARAAMVRRDYIEAEKSLERYLRRSPEGAERWETWNLLVELALNVHHDHKAARDLLETMLIEYADAPRQKRIVEIRLAEEYRLTRKYDRAVDLWSAVAEDLAAPSQERAEAYKNLAAVYLRRLEFELSKEALGYCLGLDITQSMRAMCLYDLAASHMATEDNDEGIATLRSILTLKDIPESMRTLSIFMLADALEQQEKYKESLELFESILASYPNGKVVENRIGFLKNRKPKTKQQK